MPLAKAIARNIFKAMTGKGLRPMALIRYAQQQGGTYRKTDMLKDIRKFEQRSKYETLIQNLKPGSQVPKSWMVETDLGDQGKYRIHGYANFYDDQTGQYYEQAVSFYTNDYEANTDYEEAFADHFGANYKSEDLEFLSFTQGVQEHNAGWSY